MTPSSSPQEELLPPGTPVDLDSCAREPIHLSGAVQPRGVLLVASDPELVVEQVSDNVEALLGLEPSEVLGRPLAGSLGVAAHDAVSYAISAFGDLRARNPIEQSLVVRGVERLYDLILHRTEQGLLLVEIEPAEGPRPLSFPNTYLAVRESVEALNAAVGLRELYQLTTDAVRRLTGFDRVMVYRYDRDWNGEVVAETRRPDLETFLGLHYPASDIPAQARALYERNWIRLISDVAYTPAPLVPSDSPSLGAPVDLTFSTLRSVSPIHVEYLQNMGVRASMSISLLQDGRLWGLIVCHHYDGPHTPPYGIRTAAEFLGSALSIRLHDREDAESVAARLTARSRLAHIVGASRDAQTPLARSLAALDLHRLVPAGGVVVRADGLVESVGVTPPADALEPLLALARAADDQTAAVERVAEVMTADPAVLAGALVVALPGDGYVVWTRPETRTAVDWGGDPHTKARAVRDGAEVRISPRQSFERWTEAVRGRSDPWTEQEVEIAQELRHHLVESLYARSRFDVALAESVQRSLLPPIPGIDGWSLTAHYQPAAGGRIGGDWYDAFELPDRRLALVLGDVAGHGVPAAGAMAQLRNVLRAYLHGGAGPRRSLELLNAYVVDMHPQLFATAFIATVDPMTGEVTAACAGHPLPLLVDGVARPVDLPVSPPLGVPVSAAAEGRFTIPTGATLVAFSDGLVERRGEDIQVGIERLTQLLGPDRLGSAGDIVAAATTDGRDDVTVLLASRLGPRA